MPFHASCSRACERVTCEQVPRHTFLLLDGLVHLCACVSADCALLHGRSVLLRPAGPVNLCKAQHSTARSGHGSLCMLTLLQPARFRAQCDCARISHRLQEEDSSKYETHSGPGAPAQFDVRLLDSQRPSSNIGPLWLACLTVSLDKDTGFVGVTLKLGSSALAMVMQSLRP